jgi:hypothetical protein
MDDEINTNSWRFAEVTFSADWSPTEVLQCPNCGEFNLHHGSVRVYDRAGEDCERVAVTDVAYGKAETAHVLSSDSGNPSLRRSGLAIAFWCEHCTVHAELTLAQHKGSSFLKWRFLPNGVVPANRPPLGSLGLEVAAQ